MNAIRAIRDFADRIRRQCAASIETSLAYVPRGETPSLPTTLEVSLSNFATIANEMDQFSNESQPKFTGPNARIDLFNYLWDTMNASEPGSDKEVISSTVLDVIGNAEGWSVFSVDGDEKKLSLQKIDEAEKFATDQEAVDFVKEQAALGSKFHQGVLDIVRTCGYDDLVK